MGQVNRDDLYPNTNQLADNDEVVLLKGGVTVGKITGGRLKAVLGGVTGLDAEDVNAPNVSNVKTFSGVGDGIADDRTAIASADTAGNAFLPPGTWRVASNLTISNHVWFADGAKLKPASGVTVTINGTLDAPLSQVFDISAGGTVTFGANAVVSEVYPEWWGAVGDDVTSDAGAINAALTSGVKRTRLAERTYLASSEVTINADEVQLVGSGTKSHLHMAGAALHIDGRTIVRKRNGIRNLQVTRTGVAGPAIWITGGGASTGANRWRLDDVYVLSSTGPCLEIAGAYIGTIVGCYFLAGTIGVNIVLDPVLGTVSGNAITFHGGEIQGCAQALVATSSTGITFHGTTIEGNTKGVEFLSNCRGQAFTGCYFEANGTHATDKWDIKVGTNSPNCHGLDVSGCVFFDAAGAKLHAIHLIRCQGVNIEGNTFLDYGDSAVLVNEATSATVRGSTQNNSSNTAFATVNLTAGTVFGERTFIRKLTSQVPGAGGSGVVVQVAGDANPRLVFVPGGAGGSIQAGDGTNPTDTTLRRASANRWLATGDFEIDGTLDHDGSLIGEYGNTPVARPAAYTQTFSTASRTHAARTHDAITDNSGGTASATIADTPTLYDEAYFANTIASLTKELNDARTDARNTAEVLNQLIDDLQLRGALQ